MDGLLDLGLGLGVGLGLDNITHFLQARQKEMYKSRESLYSTMLPVKESKESGEECGACTQCDTCCDSCCCSFWAWVLALLFAVFGFLGKILFTYCHLNAKILQGVS